MSLIHPLNSVKFLIVTKMTDFFSGSKAHEPAQSSKGLKPKKSLNLAPSKTKTSRPNSNISLKSSKSSKLKLKSPQVSKTSATKTGKLKKDSVLVDLQ